MDRRDEQTGLPRRRTFASPRISENASARSGSSPDIRGQLLPLLPAAQAEDGHKALLSLREVMSAELSSQADMFRLRETSIPTRARLEAALDELHEWIGRLRLWILATNVPVEESVRLLGLADRFEMAGKELLAASHEAAALRLRRYLGDYIL